ncbi:TraK domain-containing protein [Geoalkalibacter sp.]|uniref:TraK domain-containing protein n=1 Tax=Geoalkalibacter sp. TaxID=3041440 RepID=UPI00272EA452|nr:type-F conjugative transfer system secretin TraK [Geoalkalibacter sp.]
MRLTFVFILLALLLILGQGVVCASSAYEEPMLLPEVTNYVILSATDVNRISCPEPIEDIIFSSEKQIEGRFVGKDAFIKFKPMQRGAQVIFPDSPVEMFVVCAGAVYTLIAKPDANHSALTLRLSSPRQDTIKENIGRFEAMPLDRIAPQLIQEAYLGKLPSSYSVRPTHRLIDLSKDLLVVEKKVVSIEGVGLELTELSVRSAVDPSSALQSTTSHSAPQIRLMETDFVKPAVGEKILAVALADQVLRPGEETRVFIVRHKGGH